METQLKHLISKNKYKYVQGKFFLPHDKLRKEIESLQQTQMF